jgi:hypothetical protein
MRLFNKDIQLTVKTLAKQPPYSRKSGYKVGMDCVKNAHNHGFLRLLAGVK